MKEKKGEINNKKITGYYNKDAEFKGELFFEGSFRIDGYFKGKIDSEAILIVGDDGKVEGEISVGCLVNHGEIKGNIQAKDRVEICSKGRVIGTITSPKLVIEEGAYLEAECQTSETVRKPPTENNIIFE